MTKLARAAAALALSLALGALTACSGSAPAPAPTDTQSAEQGAWPRTFDDAIGQVTLDAQPQRIVSTSMVLTGSLLAIDAPVIGTGASRPGAIGLDERGLFSHWAPIATERGVDVLFDNAEIDVEAVAAAKPDLIFVSKTGGDSFMDAYDQLAAIAPVAVVDYNTVGWEEVTRELGEMTGHETEAQARLDDFDAFAAETKASIQPPAEPVQMVVWAGEGKGLSFALPNGPHDKILQMLGVPLDQTDLSSQSTNEGGSGRNDFAFLSEENSVAALTSKDLLLVGNDDADAAALAASPAYAQTPAVAGGKVVPLGLASFKLDYYSARDMVEHIAAAYKK